MLILRSALTRWNHHAPAALTIDEPAQRDLLSTARLTSMDGRTVRATVSATLHQIGFVGTVTIALTRQAGPTTHAVSLPSCDLPPSPAWAPIPPTASAPPT